MKKLIIFLMVAVTVFGAVWLNGVPVYGETIGSFEEMLDENTDIVRNAMLKRSSQVKISFTVKSYPVSSSARKTWLREKNTLFFEKVYEHGVSPFAGDYLASHVAGVYTYLAASSSGDNTVCSVTYTFLYYDTLAQQNAVEAKTEEILASLKTENKSDCEKASAIYNYICQNTKYWYGSLDTLKFTAYAALIERKAVCQGYAGAFYALAMRAGLDARIISGKDADGGEHSWNLVKIDGKNYLLDCTWDAANYQNGFEYDFFLKSQADFNGHNCDEQFKTTEFTSKYPLAATSYKATGSDNSTGALTDIGLGDTDGDGSVTAEDSRLTLRKAVGLEVFSAVQTAAGDADFDGYITSADARLILRIAVKLENAQELIRQKNN